MRIREPLVLLVAAAAALIWSGLGPLERGTWWLEVAPVLIAAPLLIFTFSPFPLSPLLYRLIFLHALVLMVGGHYTYAQVPAGFWVQDLLDLTRNHYDRLGHFVQGFVPAILAREILLRRKVVARGPWLFAIAVSVCLAFSASYELVEWWAALIGGSSAESFLGTQGDVWDTQWDMFLALLGATSALALLGRAHDRSIQTVMKDTR